MKIDPKGKIPPSRISDIGSMYLQAYTSAYEGVCLYT